MHCCSMICTHMPTQRYPVFLPSYLLPFCLTLPSLLLYISRLHSKYTKDNFRTAYFVSLSLFPLSPSLLSHTLPEKERERARALNVQYDLYDSMLTYADVC